jgi:hypothetical protein
MPEQLDILEGSSDPQPRDLVRLHTGDLVFIPIYINDAPALRMVQATNTVEQAGLSRPIWPDNCQNFALPNIQADIQQSSNPAKVELDTFNLELRFACFEMAAIESAGESTLHRRSCDYFGFAKLFKRTRFLESA